jgi:metallophosphoesterase (TIGR00282 family)
MNILFIGDIVGKIGRQTIKKIVPKLRKELKIDLVIANAENSAHGSGVTETVLDELMQAKIDFFTSGDHIFKNKKGLSTLENYPIIRPANYPPGVPGKGYKIIEVNNKKILIINLIGRVFMHQNYDCPFRKLDEILANINLHEKNIFAIIVDIHAEATSEKVSLGYYADGRINALLGTHTHVMTADSKITEKGMAYITDAGMCGAYNSSLGVDHENIIKTFLEQIKYHHEIPEKGKTILNGVLIKINDKTGKTQTITPIIKFAEIK